MAYEILDHPADVRFRTSGRTLEAAFSDVVTAVGALVDGGSAQATAATVTHSIELTARNREALLFDFLNQLILFQDLEDAVVTDVRDLIIEETDSGYRLSAVVGGRPIPPDESRLDIKAPTYSEMAIEHDGEWTIEAVLDV